MSPGGQNRVSLDTAINGQTVIALKGVTRGFSAISASWPCGFWSGERMAFA
jgi:hypothetical protein